MSLAPLFQSLKLCHLKAALSLPTSEQLFLVCELWLQQSISPCYLIDYLQEIALKTVQKSGLLTPSPTAVSGAGRLKPPVCIRACIHQALFSWVQITPSLVDIPLPRSTAFLSHCYYLYKRLIYRLC